MGELEQRAGDTSDLEQDDDAIDFGGASKKVLTQSQDPTIDTLVARIRKGRLILQPAFQRDYVWTKSKAEALIESILMGIPLPVIYVAEMPDGGWEVVDGQQRLTAIKSFIDGKFPDGSGFRLGALQVRDDLRGKAFADLSSDDQTRIEEYAVRVIVIQKEGSPDLKFEVFARLNSGADKLNDMELRNCIYRGPYNDMLRDLTENPILLKIRGDAKPDVRMHDRQLVLRFLAMWRNSYLRYRSPMKQFMNREMQDHRNASQDDIREMTSVFEGAIQCAWDTFGDRAFRRYTPGDERNPNGKWEATGKLNIALWDTIMHVFTYYERRQIVPITDAVREEFCDLLNTDATFSDYIGRTTDKADRVQYRARVWKERMDSLVTVPRSEARSFSLSDKEDLYLADKSCAICGQKILDIDDAEVDHVAHYWRGGRTLPENGRLTHRFCNRSRGGKSD